MGAYLLGLWAIPAPVVEAVAFHHRPSESGDDGFTALTPVHVADALVSNDSPGSNVIPGLDYNYLEAINKTDRLPQWIELPQGKREGICVMNKKVLLVDDDRNILDGCRRVLRGSFDLVACDSGAEGLDAITEHGPFAVAVSDYRMPGMNGVQFLSRVRQVVPDTVRIMLTGQADMQAAIDAINDGAIFRFLNKPCSTELLTRTLNDGVEQFRLITAERELLDKTLKGAIGLLADLLAVTNPVAFSK